MVKLLILRASIVLWKRAISISDRLKPSTWKLLAIVQAGLAVFLFCIYGAPDKSDPQVPPVRVVDLAPTRTLSLNNRNFVRLVMMPDNSASPVSRGPYSLLRLTSGVFGDGARSNQVTVLVTSDLTNVPSYPYRINSDPTVLQERAMVAAEDQQLTRRTGAFSIKGLIASIFSLGDLDLPSLPPMPVRPSVVLQMSSPPEMTLLQIIQAMVFLFQAVCLTIGSIFASVFGWIGYRRGRADLILKELQVLELRARVGQMAREREREVQEAAKSGIIICS